MEPPPPALAGWSRADADAARARHESRARRLERVARADRERLAAQAQAKLDALPDDAGDAAAARRRATIEAAIARARARREAAR